MPLVAKQAMTVLPCLCRSAGLVQCVRRQVLPVGVHMQRRHRAPQCDEDLLCAAENFPDSVLVVWSSDTHHKAVEHLPHLS